MKYTLIVLAAFSFWACQSEESKEVNVYTHRHYDVDKEIFESFSEETGIQVNVVSASADELIQKMTMEGEHSPADLLITVDAGRLARAKEKELFQEIETAVLEEQVPSRFRDKGRQWYGMTYRARVFVYHPDRVEADTLSTYEQLADSMWNDRLVIRSSSNIYNQSLLASIIAANGVDEAKGWAEQVHGNLARSPQGGDRDQIKAVAQGEGDLAVVNTYYLGLMLNDKDPKVREAAESVEIFFPNQEGRGTHINVSGVGVARYAPNKEHAVALLEYLTDKAAQEKWAAANYEYPINPKVEQAELLKQWGTFKADSLPLSVLGDNNAAAVRIFNEVGWN
jgi:iron(III) transport system substrate-binding protein